MGCLPSSSFFILGSKLMNNYKKWKGWIKKRNWAMFKSKYLKKGFLEFEVVIFLTALKRCRRCFTLISSSILNFTIKNTNMAWWFYHWSCVHFNAWGEIDSHVSNQWPERTLTGESSALAAWNSRVFPWFPSLSESNGSYLSSSSVRLM